MTKQKSFSLKLNQFLCKENSLQELKSFLSRENPILSEILNLSIINPNKKIIKEMQNYAKDNYFSQTLLPLMKENKEEEFKLVLKNLRKIVNVDNCCVVHSSFFFLIQYYVQKMFIDKEEKHKEHYKFFKTLLLMLMKMSQEE